jgi:hypothetical protein
MTNVAPGSYAVTAKTVIVRSGSFDDDDDDDDDGGSSSSEVRCTLDAGSNDDYGEARARRATISTQVLTTFSSTGTIALRCRRLSGASVVARQTSIVAVSIGNVSRTAVSG